MTAITVVIFLYFIAKTNNIALNGKKYVTKKQTLKLQLTLVFFPFKPHFHVFTKSTFYSSRVNFVLLPSGSFYRRLPPPAPPPPIACTSCLRWEKLSVLWFLSCVWASVQDARE
jgi:hypothetical protein